MNKSLSISLLLTLLMALSAGCTPNDTGKGNVETVSVEERIRQIEAKTDMPPQAKAAAIAQLKAREASTKQVDAERKKLENKP